MTTKQNTGQTSVADDTALTTSNSGGTAGDAYDGPVPYATASTSAQARWSATAPVIAGTKSVRLSVAGTGTARVYWNYATAGDVFQGRVAVRNRIDPGGPNLIFAVTDTTYSGNYPVQVAFTTRSSTRHVIVMCKGVEVHDFGTLPSFGTDQNDFYWFDFYVVKGTTTSTPTGKVGVRMYDYDGTLLGEYVNASVNTGTANIARMIFGGNGSVTMDVDYAWTKAGTDADTWVGLPSMALVPPTVDAIARPAPFLPGLVTITDLHGRDTDGTIREVHADVVSGQVTATATATPTSGLNTAHCTYSVSYEAEPSTQSTVETWVVDNAGQESARRQFIVDTYPGPDSDVVRVLESLSTTGWTTVGETDALRAVTDSLDSSTRESGVAPNDLIGEWRISAVEVGMAIRFWTKAMRSPSTGVPIAFIAELVTPAGTVVETETLDENGAALLLGTTPTVQVVKFSGDTLTTPASRVDLRVRYRYTQTA